MPGIIKGDGVGWFIEPSTIREIDKNLPALQRVLGLPELPPRSFAILLFIAMGAVFVEKAAMGFAEIEFSNPDTNETGTLALSEMIGSAYDQIVVEPKLEQLIKL